MTMKYIALEATIEFPFSVNDPATGGVSDADSNPPFDVRLHGSASNTAPIFSGFSELLSHGDYPEGQYTAMINATAANGFAADNVYSVYCSAAVTITTGAVIGEFTTSALLDAAGIRTALGLATNNLDTQLGATKTVVDGIAADYATGADVTNVDDKVDLIKTQTDKMVFTVANQLDVNVLSFVGQAYKGDGTLADKLRSTLVA